MNDLEKIRAVSLLSTLALTLIVLFALQVDSPSSALTAPQRLQLCATSKGALCPDPAARVRGASIATLGAMTVVAERLPMYRLADRAEAREAALHLARARESTPTRTAQAAAKF